MYPPFLLLLLLLLLFAFSSLSLPLFAAHPPGASLKPDPEAVQPFRVTGSPPATIPAFPEQSSLATCPLDLPDELFRAVKASCGGPHLHRGRCCPVLAAWLYSAYSATALRGTRAVKSVRPGGSTPPAYDLPVLPDDSENCVDGIGRALKHRGLELVRPNETCDVAYCYCGIRLHHLSCPGAFEVNSDGKIVGNENVKRLERDCLNSHGGSNGVPGLDGCSKCLNSLYKLNHKKTSDPSKADDRTTRMHNKDCELMGLTWLLAKNRTAYIHTVASVLRPIMMSPDGSDPQSCTLGSDGMPLAVDSSEISGQSSSIVTHPPGYSPILFLCLTYVVLLHLPNIS